MKSVNRFFLVLLIAFMIPNALPAVNTAPDGQTGGSDGVVPGAKADEADAAVAATPLGQVRGRSLGDIVAWLGIPYAQPPVGKLRFKAPLPVQPWTGVLDAGAFGHAAPQPPPISNEFTGKGATQSEDCLYLNIWARAGVKNRPVMVWYHGGAYMSGESSLSLYNGKELARSGDVIVVSVNYRLGALGCLHFADLAKASGIADDFVDNPALRDQVAALEWINKNISAFGGDPGNVTIFGESAGGSSVIALLCAPGAKGLIHRVIAESPAPSCIYGRDTGTFYATKFLSLLGLKPEEVGQLRDMPVDKLVDATQKLLDLNALERPGSVPFGPTAGTESLPLDPLSAAVSGAATGVPLIIGTNHDEATLFEDGDPPIVPTTPALIEKMLDITNPEKKSIILSAYPGYPSHKSVIEAATDTIFLQPSIQFAEAYSLHSPVWMYRFDYSAPLPGMLNMGATHGSEIVYVFHTFSTMPGRLLTLFSAPGTKKRLGRDMQSSWVNFAISGDPNGKDSKDGLWPAYDTKERETRIFGSKIKKEKDPDKKRRETWQGVTTYH